MADRLRSYRAKRDFEATPEPAPARGPKPSADQRFVIHEHHARRLHWDLRLERDGVLVSWAVPKGIPETPEQNHLAVHVEDHPLSYIDFRGEIPANIARAKLELEDAETRKTAAERDVEQQVRSSLLTLENTRARVEVAGENVAVAEEALQIARDRKSSGYGSSVEVDRAEDAYRQAHEDLIAARADAALAWLEVQRATGSIRDLLPGSESK